MDALSNKIQEFLKQAGSTCGGIHSVYIVHFSQLVDDYALTLDNESKDTFISLAKKEDYLSISDIGKDEELNLESGFCIHGLFPYCCPCGCGE